MKIHFVTGKGGVGKSLFSLALAHKLSQSSNRVILAELGEVSFFEYLFESTSPSLPFKIEQWDGHTCLKQYVKYLLKIEALYKLFFENSITRTLVDAAPGLKELAILGKITSGPPRNMGPKIEADCLVVDAFSSGHFLALLQAPLAMAQTFRFGPMAEQSKKIIDVINDPGITQIHIVTLSEELPLTEAFELSDNLSALVSTPISFWINKFEELPVLTQACKSTPLGGYLQNKNSDQNKAINKFKSLNKNFQTIPFIYQTQIENLIFQISQTIKL